MRPSSRCVCTGACGEREGTKVTYRCSMYAPPVSFGTKSGVDAWIILQSTLRGLPSSLKHALFSTLLLQSSTAKAQLSRRVRGGRGIYPFVLVICANDSPSSLRAGGEAGNPSQRHVSANDCILHQPHFRHVLSCIASCIFSIHDRCRPKTMSAGWTAGFA